MPEKVVPQKHTADASVSSLVLRGLHAFSSSGSAQGDAFTSVQSSSLGASPLSFERTLKTAVIIAALGTTVTFADPQVAASLAPRSLEVPNWMSESREASSQANVRATAHSLSAIMRALHDEPIEDGVTHRAEPLLASHIATFGEGGLLTELRTSDSTRASALLRLLGRSSGLSPQLRKELVTWGLSSPSVELRDSAIQAVENWGDRTLAGVLRAHEEPVGWLSDYATNVVRDLEA